jgi:drug/metabolite transporter (DMT)-like permease
MRGSGLRNAALYGVICLIWSSTWLGIKLGLDGVPPLLGAGMRFGVSGLLFLLPIAAQRRSLRLSRESRRLIGVVGVSTFGISYGLVYWSEQFVSSGLASVLFCVYPFFVALLAHYWLHLEELTWKKLLGIGMGFCGIVVIYADQMHSAAHSAKGILAVLLAALASSVSLVYLKKHGKTLNTLVLNFYSMLLGSSLLLLAAGLTERGTLVHWSAKNIVAILYLAIFGSVVAFTIYFYLLKQTSATQMSLVSLICPVLALLLGSWALHERVSGLIMVGAVLVLIGILVAHRTESVAGADSSAITEV